MDQDAGCADSSRMNPSLPFLITSLLFTACTTSDDGDADLDDTVADGKADGIARPSGVYSRTEATDDQLEQLMLLPDHTFLRYFALGDWRERGTYSFSKSTTSTRRYIRFLDDAGELIDCAQYTMHGSVVRLRPDGATAAYPMFSVATREAAWTDAVKTDWFDEAFQDWGAEAFPRAGIRRSDLPASVRTVYDQVANDLAPNEFPLIYRFDLHGAKGFELDGGTPRVRLFDASGHQVAVGDGASLDDFEWQ